MNSQQQNEARFQDPVAPGAGLPPEELEITRLINDRLRREDCMDAEDRETISYRIAEIMVTAKRMYTTSLPRLTNVSGESTATMDDDMEGMRSTFLHLRDLLHDFDCTFFSPIELEDPTYNFDGEQEEEDADMDADGDSEDELPT
jgi:hypothetical protein